MDAPAAGRRAAAVRLESSGGMQSSCAAGLRRFNVTVVAVLAVFVYLYTVDVACVILPWLSVSVPGMLNLLALTGSTGMALACYFSCMFTDPGRVPPGWVPDEEVQLSAVQEVKKKGGAPRYCKKCNAYKPPRSHHCRVCERCVLRMDHHCPWANNCIGHANYHSFFLMLVYCSIALTHTSGLLLAHGWHMLRSSAEDRVVRVGPQAVAHSLDSANSNPHLLLHIGLQTFAVTVALPTTIAVVMLLAWHIRMVASNKTTIEHAEGVTAQIKAAAGLADRQRHPYDLGCHANVEQILGDDALTWCLPRWHGTPGGLSYASAFDASGLGF